jgi:hypothetical protein
MNGFAWTVAGACSLVAFNIAGLAVWIAIRTHNNWLAELDAREAAEASARAAANLADASDRLVADVESYLREQK